MSKGISAVIATLLMLVITVSISVTAYGFVGGVFTSVTDANIELVDSTCQADASYYVVVKNLDRETNVSTSDIIVIIDDVAASGVSWDMTSVPPEGTTIATITNPIGGPSGSSHRAKLVGPSNTVQTSVRCITVPGSSPPPPDTEAPSVAMTSPGDGSTVSGASLTVSATATDNVGVVGVQFLLDGANLGAEDTTAPYSVTWDTTSVPNSPPQYTLAATARDATGNTSTDSVTVTVNNGVPDITPPVITDLAPTNSTYGATSVWANATLDEPGTMTRSLDGGSNISLASYPGNFGDLMTAPDGYHNVTFYATDSSSNEAIPVTVFFTVDTALLTGFISDNFNDNSINGSKWYVSAGSAGDVIIEETQLLRSTSDGASPIKTIQSQASISGDFNFTFKARVTSLSVGNLGFGVMDADRSDGNGFFPFFRTAGSFNIYRRSPGSWTLLQGSVGSYATGIWNTYSIVRTGQQFSFYKDGAQVGSTQNIPSVGGSVYIIAPRFWNDATVDTGTISFDDVNVITYPDVTPPVISLQSPANTTYFAGSLWANATINEAGTVKRSLDGGANVTLMNSSGNWNELIVPPSPGPHSLKFYAVDSSGNQAAPSTVFFTVNWLAPWTYRKPVNVTSSLSLSDYEVQVIFDSASLIGAGKMRSDCGDVRFTDTDGTTLRDYWIESGCNTASTRAWVRMPSVPSGFKVIYMYYGSPAAPSQSNGFNAFHFFDDFDSGPLDTSKWSVSAGSSYTLSGGVLRINVGAVGLQSQLPFNLNDGYMTESRIQFNSNSETQYGGVLEVASSQFIQSGNGGADALIIYMVTSTSGSNLVQYWGGTGSGTGYNAGSGTAFTSVLNTWYILGDETRTSTRGVWKDYASVNSLAVTWAKNINWLSLGFFSGLGTVNSKDTSYDWVRVRKYASPQPAASIGAEQT